ncbi:hypothetical protein Pfo_007536 [Paulownia fortunei]|nr:hypothetical protein Pfo_007536 [Paulownia fortunei]
MISRQIQTLFQLSKTSTENLHLLQCLLLKTSLDHHEYFFSQLMLSAVSASLHQSVKLFAELLRTSDELKPDNFTYPFVFKACGRCSMLGLGGSVHSMVLKAGYGSDSHVNNTLLTMYGGCGVVEFSRRVFDEMRERDVVSWSSMIAAYVDCNLDLDALRVFKDMNIVNVKPNLVTFVSLLSACTNLLNTRLGKSIHSHILINGIELHVSLGTALLNMYAKSGHLEEAFHIFNSISEKNLLSWTVMISCLADYGHGEEAISLFTRMEEVGLRPDSVSFSAILSGCSHRGLLHKGQELFEKMVNVYNIKPTMEHYGCLVDLFGRAGKIEEAYQIIVSMPIEPNSVILRSYLSACKHHGRPLYMDKHLMQLLLKIEPDIGANYVLAATVSSATGYWNDMGEMRDDMKIKGLKKVPGYSWVQAPGGDLGSIVEGVIR